jgi:hypothetical protein
VLLYTHASTSIIIHDVKPVTDEQVLISTTSFQMINFICSSVWEVLATLKDNMLASALKNIEKLAK